MLFMSGSTRIHRHGAVPLTTEGEKFVDQIAEAVEAPNDERINPRQSTYA